MPRRLDERDRYDVVAARTAAGVLRAYSTSFGLGTALLAPAARRDIAAVYGLVRLADEVVDTYRGPTAAVELDELHGQVGRALASGYSANLVVHAFARAARHTGIGPDEVDPFFASMRADLTVRTHDAASHAAYVYGSAQVVGVMCLRVFLNADRTADEPVRAPGERALAGARALGAAFQDVNFLRDLGADTGGLGRSYLPGVGDATGPAGAPPGPDAAAVRAVLDRIDADLATATCALDELPLQARCAVAVTIALYRELARRLTLVDPAALAQQRIRVGDPTKLVVAGRALAATLLARAGAAG